MTVKVPVRTVFNSSGDAIGLSEFQAGEAVDYEHGGTGLTVLGTPNQVLKVNNQGTEIIWAADAQSNVDPYLEVANANITFVTKSTALTSNNNLKILINDRIQVANVNQTFVTKSVALTSNNNLKVLIDDRVQVANARVEFLQSSNTSITSNAFTITTEMNEVNLQDRALINPAGFITLNIGGVNYKLPFFS